VHWSDSEGVLWRRQLPGPGSSSPIVVGGSVLVTCYSGYAETVESPGRMENLVRHVVCFDRDSGREKWSIAVPADQPESKYEGGNNTWHGYSSSTPVSDGRRVYVFFGRSGVHCLDLDGGKVWHASVGTGHTGWGSGASPVLADGRVIINASVESRAIIALDQLTGREVWRYGGIRGCWNTPHLVPLPDNRQELVVSLPEKLLALAPATGAELWHCDGIPDQGYVCPSVVSHEGIVYAIGGRENTALAVRAGGNGDVTATHVLWTADKGSNVSSPVFLDGFLYWVHERNGILNCLDARTGDSVFQQRIAPRPGIVYCATTSTCTAWRNASAAYGSQISRWFGKGDATLLCEAPFGPSR
jgi:outer membrane protein assembly factor BamB